METRGIIVGEIGNVQQMVFLTAPDDESSGYENEARSSGLCDDDEIRLSVVHPVRFLKGAVKRPAPK